MELGDNDECLIIMIIMIIMIYQLVHDNNDNNNNNKSIVNMLSKDIPVQSQEDKNMNELDQVRLTDNDKISAEGVQDLE